MIVRVKLTATLRNRLPTEAWGAADLDVPDDATIRTVFERFGLAAGSVHVVMVNGEMEPDRDRVLREGDSLVLIPPIAGG